LAQPKGSTGNPNGRPSGSKNKKTLEWEELGHALLTRHSERAEQVMGALPDDKFIDNYIKLLEYFKPKLQRTEQKQDGPFEQIIKYVRPDDNHPDTEASSETEGVTG